MVTELAYGRTLEQKLVEASGAHVCPTTPAVPRRAVATTRSAMIVLASSCRMDRPPIPANVIVAAELTEELADGGGRRVTEKVRMAEPRCHRQYLSRANDRQTSVPR